MTKAELVARIARETGLTKDICLAVVESMMKNVKDTVAEGEGVYLRGFGTFCRKTRKTKPGRNITKNTTVIIPEHDIPYFKPSDEFADLLKK